MSATSVEAVAACAWSDFVAAQKAVDLVPAERPIVVEIGHDLFHERFGQAYRPILVGEAVEQDRKRELQRAVTLVGPFEAELGKALDLVVLVEPLAVDGHDETVYRALSFVVLHVTPIPSRA